MTEPTSNDLLALARDEADASVRAALLVRAEQAALAATTMGAQDLLSVASVHAEDGRADDARRCIESALFRADGEIWVYRNAAALLRQIGDEERGRQALEMCEAAFVLRETFGYEWRLLAQGWAEDFGDDEAIVRCLARATVGARSVDDHCSVADGLFNLVGDRDGAAEAMRSAEAAALDGDAHAWWTIANTYASLGDATGTRRCLERGGRAAQTLDAHLVMAAAWDSHFAGAAEVIRCLEAARAEAKSAADWLAVAEACADFAAGASAIRACLDRALSVAEDDVDKRRIAAGLRNWLGDRAAADRVAPVGVAPAQVAKTRVPLAGWTPDAAALLDYLRPKVTPEILASIAQADYGQGVEKNLTVLRDIVETGLVPHPLNWCPLEVLQLTRWAEGVRVNHVERAFACTLLCIEATNIDTDASEADIAILIDSCVALGPDALGPLVGLLVAVVEGTTWEEEPDEPWIAAVFGLLLAAGAADRSDPRLGELAELVVASELLPELLTDGMRAAFWRRLADHIVADLVDAQPDSESLAELLDTLYMI